MPTVMIEYKKPETLKVLKSLAKYFDFKVSSGKSKKPHFDDILVPGDKSLDINALNDVFAGKNLDAKELRNKAWKRER
jgi:hypothetical protein